MTSFVETGLGNALVALVLAVVALVVGLVCRRPAVVHALWLLVLLKLVTPPLVSIPLPWPAEEAAPREETSVAIVIDDSPVELVEEPPLEWAGEFPATEAFDPVEESPTLEIPGPGASWETVFGLAWLTGSLAWCAIAAQRLFRFGRLLRHSLPPPDHLTERVTALAKQLGLRRPPRILLVPGHLSPMVWAMGRVTLLVPAKLVTQLSGPALDTLLAHELAHIRRRDHWVRWLELVGLGLYWWNPVVWLARRELRQAEELCCDAWVVRCLPDARRVYATALVDALDFLSRPDEPVPMLGCGLGRVHDLKWRLTMILRGQTSPRLGWTTALGVFGIAVLLLPLVPGFSPAQPQAGTRETAKSVLENLDPDARAILQADIDALIAKRVAEGQAKKASLDNDRMALLEVQLAKKHQDADVENKIRVLEHQLKHLKAVQAETKAKPYIKRREGKPDQGTAFRIEFAVKGSPQEIRATLEKIDKALKELHVTDINVRPVSLDPLLSPPVSQRAVWDPTAWKREFDSRPLAAPTGNRSGGMKPPAEKATTSPERRIDALEQKLDAVLKELEAMRKSKTAPSKDGTRKREPEATPEKSDSPKRDAKNTPQR